MLGLVAVAVGNNLGATVAHLGHDLQARRAVADMASEAALVTAS